MGSPWRKTTFLGIMAFSNDPAVQSNQLPISLDIPSDPKQLKETLSLLFKRVINAVNTKEGGVYSLQENANFAQYYTLGNPNQYRNAYRTTFDLVNLNGGNIPVGTTAMPALTTTTEPKSITGALYPVSSKGGGKGTNGVFYFTDGNINVTFDPTTQVVTVINNTAVALTSLTWEMSYLKN